MQQTNWNELLDKSYDKKEVLMINGTDFYQLYKAEIKHDLQLMPEYEVDKEFIAGRKGEEIIYSRPKNREVNITFVVDLQKIEGRDHIKNYKDFILDFYSVLQFGNNAYHQVGFFNQGLWFSSMPNYKFVAYMDGINKDESFFNRKRVVLSTSWVVKPINYRYTNDFFLPDGKIDPLFVNFVKITGVALEKTNDGKHPFIKPDIIGDGRRSDLDESI